MTSCRVDSGNMDTNNFKAASLINDQYIFVFPRSVEEALDLDKGDDVKIFSKLSL